MLLDEYIETENSLSSQIRLERPVGVSKGLKLAVLKKTKKKQMAKILYETVLLSSLLNEKKTKQFHIVIPSDRQL